jgi:resuscitation-promoting factor RpfA
MLCPRCGAPNRAQSTKCVRCGSALGVALAPGDRSLAPHLPALEDDLVTVSEQQKDSTLPPRQPLPALQPRREPTAIPKGATANAPRPPAAPHPLPTAPGGRLPPPNPGTSARAAHPASPGARAIGPAPNDQTLPRTPRAEPTGARGLAPAPNARAAEPTNARAAPQGAARTLPGAARTPEATNARAALPDRGSHTGHHPQPAARTGPAGDPLAGRTGAQAALRPDRELPRFPDETVPRVAAHRPIAGAENGTGDLGKRGTGDPHRRGTGDLGANAHADLLDPRPVPIAPSVAAAHGPAPAKPAGTGDVPHPRSLPAAPSVAGRPTPMNSVAAPRPAPIAPSVAQSQRPPPAQPVRPPPQAPSLSLERQALPLDGGRRSETAIPKVPTNAARPVPQAPSTLRGPGELSTTETGEAGAPPRREALSAMVQANVAADSSGSRSSPWAESRGGGALSSSGALDFEDEPTIADVAIATPINAPRRVQAESQPAIGKVGFSGPQGRAQAKPGPKDKERRAFADERSDTDEVPLDDPMGHAHEGAWEDIVESTGGPAEAARFGASRARSERDDDAPSPAMMGGGKNPPTHVRTEATRQRLQGAPMPEPRVEERLRARPKAPIDPAATPALPDRRGDELIVNRPVNADAVMTGRVRDFEKIQELETPAMSPRSGQARADALSSSEPRSEDTRLAAPGELAGRAPDRTLPPRKAVPGGETVAAPGELAGLVADLTKAPLHRAQPKRYATPPPLDRPRTAPPQPAKPTIEREPLGPAAIARSLDSNLTARSKTEPEAHARAREHKSASLDTNVPLVRPVIDPTLERPRPIGTPRSPIPDDGEMSMPGSLVPPGGTAIPQELRDLLSTAERQSATPTLDGASIVLELASGRRRALAILIDAVVIAIPILVPMMLGIFGEPLRAASYIDPDDVSGLILSGAYRKPLIGFLVLMLVFSALSHALAGRTLGKLAMGLELVATKTGERPKPARAVLRSVFAIFSLVLLGAGYLWLIIDRRSRAIHDWLTGTAVVVSRSRARAG